MIPNKPINTFWTDEQWQAIYESNQNIIVSAGAGSGKTAVLTERVIEKLKQGINIDNLIVLTFTNAAAFEMKERIKKKIKHIPTLKEQLNLIDQAYITTFDSFSLSIVRKYHYLLNLTKDINIIDNVLLSIKKKEIIDDIFMKSYENPLFLKLIDTFTTKDDEKIKKVIDELNSKLDSICQKQNYLDNYINEHYSESFINNQISNYILLLEKNKNLIFVLINRIKELVTSDILFEFISNIEDSFINLKSAKEYSDYLFMNNYKLPVFIRNKSVDDPELERIKQYYAKLKSYVDELTSLVDYDSKAEIYNEIMETKIYAEAIIDLIKKYDFNINLYKKEHNAFEFNDIMRFSIEILENNPNILKEIKDTTKEIMIDEYQDTNDIGQYFLSLISNNNLYMVGDIKQAIYKFRNANPNIFTNTYYSLKNSNVGLALDLNKNFRSRKEVIKGINLIFSHIMDSFIGGVNYNDNQKLIYGNIDYTESEQNNNLEILDYSYQDKIYSKDEIEIFIIADDIINKIKNKYKIFDKSINTTRDVNYNDFVILLDRKTSFDLYKKIFEYKGIPLIIHKDETFSYSNEIYAIKNLLKLINIFKVKDFSHLKYSFMSVARSYLLEYDDDLIYKNIDNILNCKDFKSVIEKLNYLATFSKDNSLSELLTETYKIFNIYLKSIKIGNVEEVNTKLDYLINISRNLENFGYDLNDFINYFDEMTTLKTDISFNSLKDNKQNAVNIMTIHKSKGLEFPICYLANLYKEFNARDIHDNFLFDNEIGIICPTFNEGIKDTIYKKLVKDNYLKEDISERIRVLYVALTRAKEKLIIVSNLNDLVSLELPRVNNIVNDLERLKYKSFQDILLSIKDIIKPFIIKVEYNVNKDYDLLKKTNYHELLKTNDTKYTCKTVNIEKSKTNKIIYSTQVNEIITNDFLEIGKNIHEVLEYLDFNNYYLDLNNYELDEKIKEKIKKLFTMPFMKNISSAKIYKELPIDSGIIDLLIENEKIIIVDYKIMEINKESYKNQIKNYMKYIKIISNKEVEGYLYSIINCEYIKIDEI
ncbi:MAG: UvrD-helicase domain-containing protein [Bacilli bacterium]